MKRLIDSSVAFVRDQEAERQDTRLWLRMILKCQTFTMDFENWLPINTKIGLFGNNGVFMPMVTLLSHMAGMESISLF
jgi:hypothetical protein